MRILVEGAVIVGSILLAFAIDAWWAGVQERREERQLLVSLEDEFLETRKILDQAVAFHERRMDASLRLLDSDDSTGTSASQDLLSDIVYTYLHFGSYYPKSGVLDGALASGYLDLISDDVLRSRLAGWPRVWREYAEQNEVTGEFVRESRHYLVNSLAISESVIAVNRERGGSATISTPLADIPVDAVLRFLESTTAQNYAALRFDYESLAVRDATAVLRAVDDILRLIDASQG